MPGTEKEGIENLIENDKNSKKHFNPLKRFDKKSLSSSFYVRLDHHSKKQDVLKNFQNTKQNFLESTDRYSKQEHICRNNDFMDQNIFDMWDASEF